MLLCLHFKDMIKSYNFVFSWEYLCSLRVRILKRCFIKPAFFSCACKSQFWNVKKALSWLFGVRKVLVSIHPIQIVEASQSSNGWLPARVLISFRNTISPFSKYLLTYLFGCFRWWLQHVRASSLTRDQTRAHCIGSTVLATGPPRKYSPFLLDSL